MREGRFLTLKEVESLQVKWPTVIVYSQEFGALPIHDRLHRLAIGYLQSAKTLCNELGERDVLLTWPRASVVCFCYYHSIELFLKACIRRRAPSGERCHHDVTELKKRYLELFPERAFFDFQMPWEISIKEIEDLMGKGTIDVEQFEDKRDQVYRYMSDKEGRSPKAIHVFAPGTWLGMIEQLEDDIDRIWSNINEAEGLT
jgi:hypothetical protein